MAVETMLVVANVVLVLITAWYAWQTHQTVVEMRESRRAAVRPFVRLDIENFGAGVLIKVENVGSGPALDAAAVIELNAGPELSERLEWSTPVLRPGESRLMHMPQGNPSFNQLRDVSAEVRLTGTCASATGESVSLDDSIRFESHTRKEVTVSSSADISARLKTIADALEQIRRSMPAPE